MESCLDRDVSCSENDLTTKVELTISRNTTACTRQGPPDIFPRSSFRPAAGDSVKNQVRISRNDDGHLLTIVAEGRYQLSEVEAALTAAVKDVPPGRECCLLMDIREAEAVPTQDELRKFVAFLASPALSVAKRAAWVVSGDVHYGVARQLSALAEPGGIDIGVFRDTPSAFQWLDAGHKAGHAGEG